MVLNGPAGTLVFRCRKRLARGNLFAPHGSAKSGGINGKLSGLIGHARTHPYASVRG